MAINTKTVSGRRDLKFTKLDDIVADAEKLVTSPQTKTLGELAVGPSPATPRHDRRLLD